VAAGDAGTGGAVSCGAALPGHPQGRETNVGDATQIRFEAALLKAVREAAARGLSSTEATGMFKAALIRLEAMERPEKPRE
jgi:ribosomal protein S12 methylthiotransferase accessory factor YcaO